MARKRESQAGGRLRRRGRTCLSGLVVACAAAAGLSARPAAAGNRETNPLSNEAALTGGAVTALGRDTGAIYYNPAGLGAVRRTQFNLSTQAAQFRARIVPYAAVADLPNGRRDAATLSSLQGLVMPSSLAVTRHIGRGVTLGLGYFAPDYDYYDYSASLQGAGGGTEYDARIQVDGWVYRYHAGAAVGWQPHPRFRIGATLFGTYGWQREEMRMWIDAASGTADARTDATRTVDFDNKRSIFGGEAVVGLQWEFAKNVHLGLTFRTPRFVAFEIHRSYLLNSSNVDRPDGDDEYKFEFDDSPSPSRRGRVAPMRLTMGVAYALPKRRGWVSGEMDFSPGLRPKGSDINIRPIWNVRAGARLRTAERLYFGIGVFSDRDDQVHTSAFPQFRINYYGVTTGVEFFSPVRLGKGERARSIVFSTCIAVRYSYGRGSAAQIIFDLRDAPSGRVGYDIGTVDRVAFHLFAGHLGMGTYF
ncbi:hypothetical protein OV203_03060 [Nannocystis sp. ILAH1]|uniref:OmpP1/FadL family transporter n=1 Tax=Nannocystis sp. ILAH1 TaxID=2996789 RepID=UPI00227134D4|nr:hypothetical protein [Nannocystis sp. ILAH1]MCY0986092.1 hypothetical protein [Nannocystis sp. ILAH1]